MEISRQLQAALIGCLVAGAMTATSAAQPVKQDYQLEPVVVTATKTPQRQKTANTNITVITRQQIEDNHYQDLSQALKTVPGVDMVNFGNAGYESSNAIRINGSDQIVVLIDGIRANVAHLAFPVNTYVNLDQVERIEVVKGSASVLYGSGAKGGVINIITCKAGGDQTKLTISGGNFEQDNFELLHRGQAGDTSWLINASKNILGDMKDGRNATIPQHLNAEAYNFKLTQKLSEQSNLTVAYDQYKSTVAYRGSKLQLNNNYQGARDTASWRVIYNQQVSAKAGNQFAFSYTDYDYTYRQIPTKIKTWGIQEQFTMTADDKHQLVLGYDFNQDDVGKTGLITNKTLKEHSVYAQDEWTFDERWKLTGGLRYTRHSSYGSHAGPSINLGYQADNRTNYYASYNTHYITPSVVTLYSEYWLELAPGLSIPLYLSNPDLKPESGHTLAIGVHRQFDTTSSGALHLYKRSSKDVIEMVARPSDFAEQAQNIDREKASGAEIQLRKQLSNHWETSIGYTYTSVRSSAYHGKNRDGFIPKGTVNIGATYRQKDYDIGIEGRYIIDRNGPLAESFPKNNYLVLNLSANYRIHKNLSSFIRINNILDTYYAEQTNYTDKQYGTPYDCYSAPGRTVVAGMQYQF